MSNDDGDGSQDAPPAGGALGGLGKWVQRASSYREGGEYRGLLSYAAKWHALLLGFGVGYAGGPELRTVVVAYALGRGGKGALGDSQHVRDIAKEPGYAIAGVVLGTVAKSGPAALEGLLPTVV